jgi:hypothetical protein
LQPYVACQNMDFRAKATMILAYCINEDEMDQLKGTQEQCNYIVTELLAPALANENKRQVMIKHFTYYCNSEVVRGVGVVDLVLRK